MFYAVKTAPPPRGDRTEFVMSDDSIDRVGDIVEASGWQLANFKKHPIALFNHDPDQVIGKWIDVRVVGNRLVGKLELAAAGTSALVDSIRRLVEQDILRAVSVGFRALQKEKLTEKADEFWGPFRFLKSELLECSLVSVPANPHALATAKGLAPDLVAEIFRKPASENLDRSVAPHGKPAAKSLAHNGANMTITSTIAAKIQNAQSDIQVMRDALNELLGKDELSADDTQRYADLPKQIEEAKSVLEGHRVAERAMMDDIANNRTASEQRAAPGTDLIPYPEPAKDAQPTLTIPPAPARVFAQPKKRLEYPELLIRSLACWSKAEATRERDLPKALREMYRSDEMTGQVLRAVTNPAQTGVATWAAELTDTLTTGFLDRLIPTSVYNQLSAMGARYTFGNANQLKIPVRAAVANHAAGNLAGSWVGEGGAKPVRRASFATVSLSPTKLAVISTFTEEMATYSPYAIESIIRQGMADDTSIAIDSYLIDAVAGRPCGRPDCSTAFRRSRPRRRHRQPRRWLPTLRHWLRRLRRSTAGARWRSCSTRRRRSRSGLRKPRPAISCLAIARKPALSLAFRSSSAIRSRPRA